jgi:choline kinase
MKAIVLSAGQGRRLLPLTTELPKCLLPVDGEVTLLSRQLEVLARGGIERAVVVIGFGADRVERHLASHPVRGLQVETLFNPFYASSDNLATCWLSRAAMSDDFLLLNGDTLFAPEVLARLMQSPPAPITVTVDHKPCYDDDDMKVSLDARGRVLAISKTMPREAVGAESIGMLLFRGQGGKLFVDALEEAVRHPGALRRWYLSVVDELAQRVAVESCSIRPLWWQEIDGPDDLARAREAQAGRAPGGTLDRRQEPSGTW